MKNSEIIRSWDLILALALTFITFLCTPDYLTLDFCKSFYNIGVTVLSIIFSIFFAALAIILTSSESDFILFIEEEGGTFTALLDSFRFTLSLLFTSLIISICFFVLTDYTIIYSENSKGIQHKSFFLIFEFVFLYSLFATGLSVWDTISFSKYRVRFLKLKNLQNSKETTIQDQ